ncbi:hypothetical protein HNQ38_002185 [Desulfovibrio intestinalis]|uniref:Uncharacterized protein n=1 Tax=Desulfovibrio intestinalis TaxID=58621 RepID=A0A7W8FHP6_9BACT|nr:hypothetical protein [Desulfovibrio intestinalis]
MGVCFSTDCQTSKAEKPSCPQGTTPFSQRYLLNFCYNRPPHAPDAPSPHSPQKRTVALRRAQGDHRAKRGSSRSKSRAALVK